jgi:pyridoxamine 5'-phosphate oxidase
VSSDPQQSLADLRVSYESGELLEGQLASDPLAMFNGWFAEAADAGLPEPNAMVLATAATGGQPSARTVLLKQADSRGFVFYTNLRSRKSTELAQNPQVAAVFPWFAMHRQVVVIGRVELIARSEVTEYFNSRPRSSQLGAWSSEQSSVIAGREVLDRRFDERSSQFGDGAIPPPDFWGGWLIRAQTVEFWQGRTSRLHDRLRYRALADGVFLDDRRSWVTERLSP